jgi:CDP-glycerol glycerophosphotransferase
VNYLSVRAFFELASAKVWIDNSRKMIYPYKNKHQYYFQTWHGNVGFKKIEEDTADNLPQKYIKTAINDSLMIDFCISNGPFMSNIYRNSFWYSGQILEYGSPRNDILVNNTDFTDVKKNLHLDENIKIILYAPTFRSQNSFDSYQLNYENIVSALTKKFNCKWRFFIRLHPNLILYMDQLQVPDNVINVTLYPDIQELLGITDILISDYSSTMFDFIFTKRPVFIYATDYNEYKKERGVHFPLSESPFLIAENDEQLIRNMLSCDLEKYNKMVNTFIERIGCFEKGNACQMVVDNIKKVMCLQEKV